MGNNAVKYEVHRSVAVITMTRPPVNGLGADLRVGIADTIDQANQDSTVQAVVLTGSDKTFSGGADVTEFGTARAVREPNLRALIDLIENNQKPVIAAIAGNCLGGGLELALGCHFRIAQADASLGLPEVKPSQLRTRGRLTME